jgi:DNA-binding NtrC family response regulator
MASSGWTVPKHILLVDDEPTILMGLSHVFRRCGAKVTSCLRRKEAEEAIQNQIFDLALLDVRLSGSERSDGLDLLAQIKERSPHTLVIIMTAFGTDEIRREALARGAAHYCDKPLNLDHLLGLVRDLPRTPTC